MNDSADTDIRTGEDPDATDLAGRYVHAVSRRLPADTRDDVAQELRATIADMAEARGGDPREAVHATLVELGDPARLAREYRGRPRMLIGPDYFDTYLAVLKPVLATALPVLFAIQLLAGWWGDDSPSSAAVIGGAVASTFQIGVQIVFWTTLVFAVIERSGQPAPEAEPPEWSPDDLPPAPGMGSDRTITVGEFVWGVVVAALIPIGLLVQRVRSPFLIDGERIPLFHPDLWSVWFPALFVLVAVMIGVEVWKFRVGRWTLPLVVANVATNLVFLAYVAALFGTQDVWNPGYVAALDDQTGFVLDGSAVEPTVVAVIAVVTLWDSVECALKHLRERQP